MKIRSILLIAGVTLLSQGSAILAQDVTPLSTPWQGTMTVTSVGAPLAHHPMYTKNAGKAKAPAEWGFYDDSLRLTVSRQEGRHLEVKLTSSRYTTVAVGTLSADGRKLQVKSSSLNLALDINGAQMSGCGTVNGGDGTLKQWNENYAAWCVELSAATGTK